MSASRAQEHTLGNTYCSRGHVHPPWNTTGILRIAKCESVCGFCQKETKTAANLRKHVAIHIKNEGLHLSIAEGSSGRGRLEMPPSELERRPSSTSTHTSRSNSNTTPPRETFSASSVLLSMSHPTNSNYPQSISQSRHSTPSPIQLPLPPPLSFTTPSYTPIQMQPHSHTPILSHSQPHTHHHHHHSTQVQVVEPSPPSIYPPHLPLPPAIRNYRQLNDPFYALRSHNLSTKIAWTAIPAIEGQRILDICKRDSATSETSTLYSSSSTSISTTDSQTNGNTTPSPQKETAMSPYDRIPQAGIHLPCYNRKVLYDEEWQAHMRDVHGVFLLWPDTWMKRVEVLDLDAFGGDIGACNGVIMDS